MSYPLLAPVDSASMTIRVEECMEWECEAGFLWRERKKAPHGCRAFETDAILGLHSPVYGGHRSGLKPDA